MSANLTKISAAPSPSPAQPDTSPVSGDTSDADFGLPSAADISAALDELNPTTQADADPAATSPEADDEADTATEEAVAATLSDEAAAPASDESTPSPEGQPPEGEAAPVAADPDVAAAPSKRDGRNDRIDELTARAKSAEEKLAQASDRLASFEARDTNRLEPDVLEAIDDPAQLAAQRSRWTKLHEWAIRHEHADVATLPDGKGGTQEFDREQVSALKAQTFSLLNEAAPKREQFLQTRAQVDAYATQAYPWLANTKAGDGATVAKLLSDLPVLRTLPGGKLLASDAFIGGVFRAHGITVSKELIERLAKEAKASAPRAGQPARASTPVRAPAAPSRPSTVPARLDRRQTQSRQADQRITRERGSEDSLAQSIAALL
jgi:hypothetical protein